MTREAKTPAVRIEPVRFGRLRTAWTIARFVRDPVGVSMRLASDQGPAVMLDIGGGRIVHHVAGRSMVEPIFRDTAAFVSSGVTLNGPEGSAQRRLRNGIIRANGAEHAHYRRLLAPFFRRVAAEALRAEMAAIAREELARLPLDAPADFRRYAARVAKRLSGLVLFGEDSGPILAIGRLVERHIELGFRPACWILPVPLPFTPYRELLGRAEEIEAAILDWTRSVRGADPARNALTALVNAPDETGAPLKEERLVGHVMNLFAAAYETTAGTLASVCFCLAQSPDLADRLAAEIGQGDDAEGLDRAFASPLMDRLIWESTRLVTPVPYQRRKVAREVRVCGVPFRPRDVVIISACATNRDPTLYPEPEAFRPERWTSAAPNPFEWVVFSAGARHCLGFWLAMTMLKVIVWSIVTSRRMTLADGVRLDLRVAITLRTAGGLPLEFRRLSDPARPARIGGQLGKLTRFPGPG